MIPTSKRNPNRRPLLPLANVVIGFLLAQLTVLSAHQSLLAAERDADLIRRENARPGAAIGS